METHLSPAAMQIMDDGSHGFVTDDQKAAMKPAVTVTQTIGCSVLCVTGIIDKGNE